MKSYNFRVFKPNGQDQENQFNTFKESLIKYSDIIEFEEEVDYLYVKIIIELEENNNDFLKLFFSLSPYIGHN